MSSKKEVVMFLPGKCKNHDCDKYQGKSIYNFKGDEINIIEDKLRISVKTYYRYIFFFI